MKSQGQAKKLVEMFYSRAQFHTPAHWVNSVRAMTPARMMNSFRKYEFDIENEKQAFELLDSAGVNFIEFGNGDDLGAIVQMLARPEDKVFVVQFAKGDLSFLVVATAEQEKAIARLSAKSSLAESTSDEQLAAAAARTIISIRTLFWEGCPWPMQSVQKIMDEARSMFHPTYEQFRALKDMLISQVDPWSVDKMRFHKDYQFWAEAGRLDKLKAKVPEMIKAIHREKAKEALS